MDSAKLDRSHPRLVTARTNAHWEAVCRGQDPQPRPKAARSAVNTTRSLGSGCVLDKSYGVLLPTVRDSPSQRDSRAGRVTLMGGGVEKRWGNATPLFFAALGEAIAERH